MGFLGGGRRRSFAGSGRQQQSRAGMVDLSSYYSKIDSFSYSRVGWGIWTAALEIFFTIFSKH
jgi:hypothetical protein